MSEIPKTIKFWTDSISKRDPLLMTKMYSENAILIPTYGQIAKGQRKILAYFRMFLKKEKLRCRIIKNESIDLGNGNTVHNGYYSFDFTNENGLEDNVLARYTYIVNSIGKIIVHHSSEQPII
jgi:hypothetical protein